MHTKASHFPDAAFMPLNWFLSGIPVQYSVKNCHVTLGRRPRGGLRCWETPWEHSCSSSCFRISLGVQLRQTRIQTWATQTHRNKRWFSSRSRAWRLRYGFSILTEKWPLHIPYVYKKGLRATLYIIFDSYKWKEKCLCVLTFSRWKPLSPTTNSPLCNIAPLRVAKWVIHQGNRVALNVIMCGIFLNAS